MFNNIISSQLGKRLLFHILPNHYSIFLKTWLDLINNKKEMEMFFDERDLLLFFILFMPAAVYGPCSCSQ
jgi:hypothetical protein